MVSDSLRERVARAMGAVHPDSVSYLQEADAALAEVAKWLREHPQWTIEASGKAISPLRIVADELEGKDARA